MSAALADRLPATSGDDLAATFAAEGFVVLHGALPAQEIDDCAAALGAMRARHPDVNVPADAPASQRFEGMDRLVRHGVASDAVMALAANTTVLEALRQILGREPVIRLTRLLAQSPGALSVNAERRGTPHLHNFGMATRPPGGRVIAWTPVDDVHPDAGPMWVLPRSHRQFADFPERLLDAVPGARDTLHRYWAEGASAEDWLAWHGRLGDRSMAMLADWMEETTAQPVSILLRRGDVLIFSNDLLHGTWPAKDPGISRRIMFTHYHAEGCELWEIGDALGTDVNPHRAGRAGPSANVRHPRGLVDPDGFRSFYASMNGFFP